MKGWDASGETVRLAPEQERIVRTLLTWHRHGISVTLPRMGRGAGKTVIMRTVAHYILTNTPVDPPAPQPAAPELPSPPVWRVEQAHGYEMHHVRDTPEGRVKTVTTWQHVETDDDSRVDHCTKIEVFLNGELVQPWTEAQRLATAVWQT